MGASTDCSLFLQSDGTVKSCGLNNYGQCGTGDTISPKLNISVISNLENVVQVATGYGHSLFLLSDGTVKSCGRNNHGQCGTGDTVSPKLALSVIPGLTNVASVYAGQYHSGFILKDGSVIIIGMNNYGQCGMGNTTSPKLNLSPIPNLSEVRQLSLDFEHSILLQKDSTVLYCGLNSQGQCGMGNTTSHTALYKIPNLIGVKQIATDLRACFYLMNDGTVKAAGRNDFGQCGNGTLTQVSTLFTIPNLINVKQVFGGLVHTLFLLEDGTVKACGTNANGECGNGVTPSVVKVPTLINNLANVTQISCGHYFSQFLFEDGSIKFCGENQYGQNGTNNIIAQSQPFLISDLTVASLQDLKPINNEVEPVIETKEFNYTGQTQAINLSPGVYNFYTRGAQGGGEDNTYYGDSSKARIAILEPTMFYVNVGQQPESTTGGWNDGKDTPNPQTFGGGGSTDIAIQGTDLDSNWNNQQHLNSRILTAKGGKGKPIMGSSYANGSVPGGQHWGPTFVCDFIPYTSGTVTFYASSTNDKIPISPYIYVEGTANYIYWQPTTWNFTATIAVTAGKKYSLALCGSSSPSYHSAYWNASFPPSLFCSTTGEKNSVPVLAGGLGGGVNYAYTELTKDSYPLVPCNAGNKYLVEPVITTNNPDAENHGFAYMQYIGQTIHTKPSLLNTYNYNTQKQTAILQDFDENIMTVANNQQTNTGTYNIAVTPKTGYYWEDGTNTAIYISWTINKIDPIVNWPQANPMMVGEFISSAVLVNGTGAGTFTWTNPSMLMTWPNDEYELVFTPTDITNYNIIKNIIPIEYKKLALNESFNFNYIGMTEAVLLEPGVYEFYCRGAQGGTTGYEGSISKARIAILETTTFYVNVGQSPILSATGGWNGGGNSATAAPGGGGSTDIAVQGIDESTDWSAALHLNSRILMAAGGTGKAAGPNIQSANGSTSLGSAHTVYSFVAASSGTLSFYSSNLSGDSYGYVYDGSTGSLIRSNDDGGGNLNFSISISVTAGKSYRLAVGGYHNRSGSCRWYATFPGLQIVPGGAGGGLSYAYTKDTKTSYPASPCNAGTYYMVEPVLIASAPEAVGNGFAYIKKIGYTTDKKPVLLNTYTYNTQEQTAELDNCDLNVTTIVNNKKTNAGSYNIGVTPISNYYWEDGTNTVFNILWVINKINPEITWPKPSKLIIGWPISRADISNGTGVGKFTWTNSALKMQYPNNKFELTFTPTDTINYNILKKDIIINLITYRFNSSFYKDSKPQELFDFTKLLL